jgi:short-subunit dehydrogenase
MAYAIVTGASGGIGLCIARELAARKYDLLLIARSSDKLIELANALKKEFGISAESLALDLSNTATVKNITDWIDQKGAEVAILINNAGYGNWGTFEQAKLSELENMMQLNMTTLVALCHGLIPYLKKLPKAYILNLASTASYQAVPTLTTYAATKAFVVLFSRGLRWELRKTSISVSCLSPGATSTGFVDRAGMGIMKERAEKFSMKPEPVARIGVKRMLQGKAEIIPGFPNWISVKLTYFLPKILVEKIAASLYDQK